MLFLQLQQSTHRSTLMDSVKDSTAFRVGPKVAANEKLQQDEPVILFPTTPTDNHVFLLGRPPLAEFLGFITTQMVGGNEADVGSLAAEWRAANEHIEELKMSEPGAARAAGLEPLPSPLAPIAEEVQQTQVYRRSFGIMPSEIAMLDLDSLVVFQKQINLRYVAELQSRLGESPSDQQLFEFCIPAGHENPQVRATRSGPNQWVFVSPSTDFRMLGAELIDPQAINQPVSSGYPSAVLGVVVGYGSNFLSAVASHGRMVLNNGSHRAYALRELGITRVPAVVQHVQSKEELTIVSSGDLTANPDRYLADIRPPLLRDYFDPALRKIVAVERHARQVRIQFAQEQLDVPG
ncbi:MAG: hypothetical protein ABI785_07780 [Gemmatimonadales bacterium]